MFFEAQEPHFLLCSGNSQHLRACLTPLGIGVFVPRKHKNMPSKEFDSDNKLNIHFSKRKLTVHYSSNAWALETPSGSLPVTCIREGGDPVIHRNMAYRSRAPNGSELTWNTAAKPEASHNCALRTPCPTVQKPCVYVSPDQQTMVSTMVSKWCERGLVFPWVGSNANCFTVKG